MTLDVESLERLRIVAVLRAPTAAALRAAGEACFEGGIRLLAIPVSMAPVGEMIRSLALEPSVVVGISSVRTREEVAEASAAGARFTLAHHFDPGVLAESKSRGLLTIMGGLTPTEVHGAHAAGADVSMLFPAALFGAPYLRALKDASPAVPVMPSGGVDLASLVSWLDAGAAAVGLGRSLMASGGPRDIQARSRQAVDLVSMWSRR